MDGKRFIETLQIKNLLSFGSAAEAIALEPLNVLIGPNASGKSNVIEAISLLQATPSDLAAPIRAGGGIGDWLWKGAQMTPVAELETALAGVPDTPTLLYNLAFTMRGQRLEVTDESIKGAQDLKSKKRKLFFGYQNGSLVINTRTISDSNEVSAPPVRSYRTVQREDLNTGQSILSQRKDPDQYPELTYLGEQFGKIKLYREWNLGRYTAPRLPQRPDLPDDFLLEDASNLGLIVNSLEHYGDTKQLLIEKLSQFYENVRDITTRIQGGTVQIFLHEKGLRQPVPATRLSDGTLRYLCLLAILLHPTPPPLVCIEEPELGLHPDIIPTVADLLVEASQRMQLIVTTHSDTLVSALSETPGSVVVCERDEDGSNLTRLDPERLKLWLEKYRLGDLWRMGELGGKRW